MANVIITNDGQSKIANAILNNTSIFPKYFKVSSTDYALDPTLTDIDGWITKDITSWLVVDDNTVLITCIVEVYEATSSCVTVGIYDIDNTLLFVGKPSNPYPPGTRQTITFEIILTNVGQVVDFSYLPWNDTEVYLLINQISTQTANEFSSVYDKLTDCQIKIDQLRNDVDNILNNTIIDAATVDGYPVDVNSTANTIPVRDSSGAINIAPASSAGQAVTLQQADDRYVNVPGDTMTGTLGFSLNGKVLNLNDITFMLSDTTDTSFRIFHNIDPDTNEVIVDGYSQMLEFFDNKVRVYNTGYNTAGTVITDYYSYFYVGPATYALYNTNGGSWFISTAVVGGTDPYVEVNSNTNRIDFDTHLYINGVPVLTQTDVNIYKSYITRTSSLSVDFNTADEIGVWLVLSLGTNSAGSGEWSYLYADGVMISREYTSDWPDGDPPITHVGIVTVDTVPKTITFTTANCVIDNMKLVKLKSL